MREKNKPFWTSARDNTTAFIMYYEWLTELAISMFEWKNLPPTVDERYMELALYSSGQAVFFRDDVLDYMCLRCTTSGNFNPYGIPKGRVAIGYNGYQKNLDDTNSVIIYNNYLRRPLMGAMEQFAYRLANLERTIDVNTNAQRTPILITCEDSQKLTMKTLYQKYEGNEPVIFGYNGADRDAIKSISTGAPYVASDLYELKVQLWNEAITRLGIANINTQKKERMITDEVTRNMGAIISSRYSRLEMRRKAADEINKLFGLNITVEFREDFQILDEKNEQISDDEGEEE